ncbi:MAG: CvpA family protein [Firmicutes bacterium]|nr:CvpA family protein [Bacillota bacterium]
MNWMDWAIVGILGLGLLTGFRKGLMQQLVDLTAVIISLYIAYRFTPEVGRILDTKIHLGSYVDGLVGPTLRGLGVGLLVVNIATFSLLYFVTKVAVGLAGGIANRMADLPLISSGNRFAGGLFGLLKGLLIIYVVVALIGLLPQTGLGEALSGSTLGARILEVSPWFHGKIKEALSSDLIPLPGR